MVQTVGIPREVFNQVNAFSIPNTATVIATFVTNPALMVLGPYTNNDPNTDQYHTRHVMYMPHQYVNLLLNQALPPRRTWEVVLVAVTADNAEVACAPLLDWLRAACTCTTVNGVAMDALPLARPPLAAPVADKDLL